MQSPWQHIKQRNKETQTTIVWIPNHTNITGNEATDGWVGDKIRFHKQKTTHHPNP